MSDDCQKKYELNSYRKNVILKVGGRCHHTGVTGYMSGSVSQGSHQGKCQVTGFTSGSGLQDTHQGKSHRVDIRVTGYTSGSVSQGKCQGQCHRVHITVCVTGYTLDHMVHVKVSVTGYTSGSVSQGSRQCRRVYVNVKG